MKKSFILYIKNKSLIAEFLIFYIIEGFTTNVAIYPFCPNQ